MPVYHSLQVIKTADTYAMPDMSPEQFANRMWNLSINFPKSPLPTLLTGKQMDEICSQFLKEVTCQGRAMQAGPDIVNNFTNLFVVACA